MIYFLSKHAIIIIVVAVIAACGGGGGGSGETGVITESGVWVS